MGSGARYVELSVVPFFQDVIAGVLVRVFGRHRYVLGFAKSVVR